MKVDLYDMTLSIFR